MMRSGTSRDMEYASLPSRGRSNRGNQFSHHTHTLIRGFLHTSCITKVSSPLLLFFGAFFTVEKAHVTKFLMSSVFLNFHPHYRVVIIFWLCMTNPRMGMIRMKNAMPCQRSGNGSPNAMLKHNSKHGMRNANSHVSRLSCFFIPARPPSS